MNIFSEIYSKYYDTVKQVLNHPKLNIREINDIISTYAFKESLLFLPEKIIPNKNNDDWKILKENNEEDKTFSPITKNQVPEIMTKIQRCFIKALLNDKRSKLFFDDEEYAEICSLFKYEQPLYNNDDFNYFDVFDDGDNYDDDNYKAFFRIILSAVKSKEILKIDYISPKRGEIFGYFLPVKLQYSSKNDKFRLICIRVYNGRLKNPININLSRITKVKTTNKLFKTIPDIVENTCSVSLQVSDERNGIERFMREFAPFEKTSILDKENGLCAVDIRYNKSDETELLIRILSFGPVVKVTSPENFKSLISERILKQRELFENNQEKGS